MRALNSKANIKSKDCVKYISFDPSYYYVINDI
jgi:hypothetical protein